MRTKILSGILDSLATNYIIRLVPVSVIGLTGVFLAGLLGFRYFRQRTLNAGNMSRSSLLSYSIFPSHLIASPPPDNPVMNHSRYRCNPDLVLERSLLQNLLSSIITITTEPGGDRILRILRVVARINLTTGQVDICGQTLIQINERINLPSIRSIDEKPRFINRRCILTSFTRGLMFISDIEAVKELLQSRDNKFREKPMLGWMEFVEVESKRGK